MQYDFRIIHKPMRLFRYWRCEGCARGEDDEPTSPLCPQCGDRIKERQWFFPSYIYTARSWEL